MFVPMLSVIQYGWTGLMRASINGHTSTVWILLETKADPNITDEVKVHYNCLYNSMVDQKGHVHYQFPITNFEINFQYKYFSLPILNFSFLASNMSLLNLVFLLSNMDISKYQIWLFKFLILIFPITILACV